MVLGIALKPWHLYRVSQWKLCSRALLNDNRVSEIHRFGTTSDRSFPSSSTNKVTEEEIPYYIPFYAHCS